jgi:hypothetical protein
MRLKSLRFRGPDAVEDIRMKYGYDGAMLEAFAGVSSSVVHKWHHYIPIYDRYFGRFVGTPVRILEIGVSQGGSLEMWRRYFGAEAVVFGIDIDPGCARFDGAFGQVRIGSQDDPGFLAAVAEEMGGPDIVLDDGSHRMEHIRASLGVLFPLLSTGGVYMIEDLHTAYSGGYGGGMSTPGNFFNDVRRMIDDMHRWYHDDGLSEEWSAGVAGIHIHDSIVVLEKAVVHAPVHSRMEQKVGALA